MADDLRQQITSGRLAPGAQLPTVAQLAVPYGVTVGTPTVRWRNSSRRA
ncbi:GntR family transcriptional regulator [Pseudonocardia sp. NPDC049154]